MKQRTLTSLITALVLLGSMLTGTVVSGAQQPPDLSETFAWQPYGLSVAYPAGWTVLEGDGIVSLHPAGRDVSDGFGPELVLFEQANTGLDAFEDAIADFAMQSGATSQIDARTSVSGAKAIRATLAWTNPAASGAMILVQAESDSALGAAYIVRAADASDYAGTLAAMLHSVALAAAQGVQSSARVASVQLPQAYAWTGTGLTLHFPAAWTVETESGLDGDILYAYPAGNDALRGFVGLTFERSLAGFTLEEMLDYAIAEYNGVLDGAAITVQDSAAISVAGHDGVAVELLDTSGETSLVARLVALDVVERDVIAVVALVAEQAAWDDFRPTASAFISSIEASAANRTAQASPAGRVPVARAAADPSGLPGQLADEMREFVWEDYGVTLSIPADWQALPRSQDYDLALVSPEALQGATGAFILFQVYPSLGAGTTIESVLQPIADDTGSDVTAYDPNGYGVAITNEQNGVVQNLVLFPYNDRGAALFVQTSASIDDNAMMVDILATLAVDPPDIDYAAVDAAFQESLNADGTLAYGAADAPVTLREYFSYTCGHCANYTLPLENLLALDVAAGRAYFEFAPLVSDAKTSLATHATYCAAEQGKGYSVYKALFEDYLQNGFETAFTPDAVNAILTDEQYDLNVAQVNACIEDETYAEAIDSVRTSFTDFGLTGTPTVVMAADGSELAPLTLPDGRIWSGTIPLEALREVIARVVEDGVSPQEAANTFFGS